MLPKFLQPCPIKKSNLIRIGRKFDGGYVIDKRIINKTKIIITCGLNDEWSFEADFQKKNKKCKVIAYDHTINNIFWVKRFKRDFISFLLLKKLKPNKIFDVFKYFDYLNFFRGNNKHFTKKIVYKKKKPNETTINDALRNCKNILLKVDIEGDEYKILKDINKNSKKINLLIIEFHQVFKNINKIKNFLSKSSFKLIHIHANNYGGLNLKNSPNVLELTLLNKKKFKILNGKSKFNYPIPGLDYSNLKRRKDIKLNFNE